MITGSVGITFILLNTLMLVANATVTTINSVTIMKAVKNSGKNEE